MDHKLNGEDIRQFVLAGHALFTLQSETTGARYTFKITKAEDGKAWFIKALVGQDNENDYVYIAYMRADLQVRLSAKSRMTKDSGPVKAIMYLMSNLDHLNPKLQVFHSCKCGRCGRTLTTPESITRGIGPECWKVIGEVA